MDTWDKIVSDLGELYIRLLFPILYLEHWGSRWNRHFFGAGCKGENITSVRGLIEPAQILTPDLPESLTPRLSHWCTFWTFLIEAYSISMDICILVLLSSASDAFESSELLIRRYLFGSQWFTSTLRGPARTRSPSSRYVLYSSMDIKCYYCLLVGFATFSWIGYPYY